MVDFSKYLKSNIPPPIWHPFDEGKGAEQSLPPKGKLILVCIQESEDGDSPAVNIGYLKYAAGDRSCPYFVRPGARSGFVTYWSDCLGDNFTCPVWKIQSWREKQARGF